MRGENYFLVLIGKDGTKYKVFSKPITLKEMDERTTKYKNKNELLSTIIKNKGLNMKVSDFKDVEIWMQTSKDMLKKESYPLYKKDEIVLNEESITSRLEILLFNKNFALELAKKYKRIKNFKPISESIETSIRNNLSYIEQAQNLTNKLLKTYKGMRNIYLLMKKYNKNNLNEELTQDDFDELRLSYLSKYERELLDIDDFTYHKDLSPFDVHRTK